MFRRAVLGLTIVLAAAALRAAPQTSAVRVWHGTIDIPTYAEGPANPNPPFDFFIAGRLNYPYPIRDALTDRRETVSWRSLHLENEFLRLIVLPDLGGHIYSCLDKRNGREMFYANQSIKKALIGYRGAWAAFGVEFNFPVSHNWMSMSPVDFATTQQADGSASIHVGNVDQVYGSQWRVELRLAPARAVLEQRVELYNPSDVRHRYYWWSNAAVQAWEDSRLVYPTALMATHGFTAIEPWPIERSGRDLSVIRNQTSGPVSLFTHGTREEFVGVYHPHTSSGTVHVASRSDLPTHKVWSWGNDREAAFWRTALSDDDSGYVELQAGLFRNQETYAFLGPQESVQFTEFWLPVRDLGGITRANTAAVLHMERTSPTRMRIALDVTQSIPSPRITIRNARNAPTAPAELSPRDVWRTELDVTSDPVAFELRDAHGNMVLSHTEGVFDRTPVKDARVGPQPSERPISVAERGLVHELEGRRLPALSAYSEGLTSDPRSLPLLQAAGRLAVSLGWVEAGGEPAARALEWLQAAHARHTTDVETQYYLGLALASASRLREARTHFESVQRFVPLRTAAMLQLARLAALDGNLNEALQQVRGMVANSPRAPLAGACEVALQRRLNRHAEARTRAQHWLTIDPTSSLLRHELTLLGGSDEALWLHLAADANRVLDLVDRYLAIGDHAAALGLLERSYPVLTEPLREPGAVAPDESPLVAYYRGYVRERLGGSGTADYERARSMSTRYVFPVRRSSYVVLHAALKARPDDATALHLLGSLSLAAGLVDPAIDAWQRARRAKAAIPTLHRNLGLALLHARADYAGARGVLEEGTTADPDNVDVYLALDSVLSAGSVAASERVAAVRRFPSVEKMPAALVFKLALALAEAGEAREAERLFHGRFFPREEGGTNVRTVYGQVLLASARAASERGRCDEANAILDAMSRERGDLAFTRGGLADVYEPPAMTRQIALVESACGRAQVARQRRERLERSLAKATAPMSVALLAEATRQLGKPMTPDLRRRLESALEEAGRVLDAAATSSPGPMELARGLLLAALGRHAESGAALRRVFLFPDRGLSHAIARDALRTSGVRKP